MNVSTRKNLILASQSPRRQALLAEAGFEFEVDPPPESVEARISRDLGAEELVGQSAEAKAQFVAARHRNAIVIASDTVAECDGHVLGKPSDRDDARRMLMAMSGRRHRVLTAVTLWDRPTDQHLSWLEQTTLFMQPWQEPSLEHYLDSNDWQGKAGAFGYQDGIPWVQIEAGLESTVVGFPVEKLRGWLNELTLLVDQIQ